MSSNRGSSQASRDSSNSMQDRDPGANQGRFDSNVEKARKNVEKKLGLKPGEWEGLELWKRKEGLDLIADSILESKQAINKFYQYATSQLQGSKTLDPDVFVNVMEEVLDLNTQLYMIRPDDYRSLTDLVDQMVGRKGIINNIIGAPAGKTVRPRSIAEQVKLIQSRLGKYKTDMEMKIMKARRGKSEVKVINPSYTYLI